MPSDAPFELKVSPIFIRNPIYGARCGTVVAIDEQGQGIIVERRFDAAGAVTGETALLFVWMKCRRFCWQALRRPRPGI